MHAPLYEIFTITYVFLKHTFLPFIRTCTKIWVYRKPRLGYYSACPSTLKYYSASASIIETRTSHSSIVVYQLKPNSKKVLVLHSYHVFLLWCTIYVIPYVYFPIFLTVFGCHTYELLSMCLFSFLFVSYSFLAFTSSTYIRLQNCWANIFIWAFYTNRMFWF